MRVGVICNPGSHRNHGAAYVAGSAGTSRMLVAAPRTHAGLMRDLTRFALAGIDLLVIDGGDGTVRDVLTGAAMVWTHGLPATAVIPSGRTNALAGDLNLPSRWTIHDAIASAAVGRFVERRPLEVSWADNPVPLRGFLFGAGAFVEGTELANSRLSRRAFNGPMVGLAVGKAILNTLLGDDADKWRAGTRMRLQLAGVAPDDTRRCLLLASTLNRLPMGLRVFGRSPGGMRLLDIDGPPRTILTTLPAVLTGRADAWLYRRGYRRLETEIFQLELASDFMLDGERYTGGSLTIRRGAAVRFASQ